MSKFFTNFEILLKSILRPKQMRDLIEEREQAKDDENRREPVSYTHLTLPTILLV